MRFWYQKRREKRAVPGTKICRGPLVHRSCHTLPACCPPMKVERAVRLVAERQHGLVSWSHARALGANRQQLRGWCRGTDWELVTSRVLRLVGAPQDERQLLMLAVLDGGPGTVVSYFSMAALWQLPAFSYGPIETSRPRELNGRPPCIGRLHRPRYLPAHHVTVIDGIPGTTLARTIFDLAAKLHPKRIERLVATVKGRSPGTLRSLHAMLPELAESGRNGIAVMREVLERQPLGIGSPETGLEIRFREILAEYGERPLRYQVDLGGHDWLGRFDCVDDELGLVVEVNSAVHHTSELDKQRDEDRRAALLAAGYREVVFVTDDQIWRRPAEAFRAVHEARARLRRTG
jgi:hypothetical protein